MHKASTVKGTLRERAVQTTAYADGLALIAKH